MAAYDTLLVDRPRPGIAVGFSLALAADIRIHPDRRAGGPVQRGG